MIHAEEFDMSRKFAVALIAAAALTVVSGQAQKASPLATLKTTAEASDFKSTSTYEDVVKFMKAVADAVPTVVHYTTYGMTNENRAMPMAVVGTGLKDISPAAVRATGKLRVHIQGNIHAGEVEGKESAQILLRELAEGKHNDWLQSTIFLITPIFNADGNEKFSLTNRGGQNGPINGMGTRQNAQGLNINRDFMKLETPEARAFVKLWIDYDPHVGYDLHTSDGSTTGYYLTYAPPLNPDTSDTIVGLMKAEWFPFVTKNIKAKHGWDTFYYGNVSGGGRGRGGAPGAPGGGGGRGAGGAAAGAGAATAAAPPTPEVLGAAAQPGVTRAWATFEHVPRFHNNYVGMRNRFALLSEAYAYATFEDRIKATNYFLEESLTFAHQNAARIKKACADADKESVIGKMEGTRAQMKTGGTVEILMGEVEDEKNPNNGASMRRRKDVVHPEQMTDMMWFSANKTEEVPTAFYVPAEATKALELLKLHGVVMRQVRQPVGGVEQFTITGNTARTANPNSIDTGTHGLRTLEGTWEPAAGLVTPAGAWEIQLNQPLARLAFYLLAPTSDDGLTAWNFLDDLLKDAKTYPVLRKK
jgi:hypothetical protein